MNVRQKTLGSLGACPMASGDPVITSPRDVARRMTKTTGRIYRTLNSRKIEIERLFESIAAVNPREAEVFLVRLQGRLRAVTRGRDNIG